MQLSSIASYFIDPGWSFDRKMRARVLLGVIVMLVVSIVLISGASIVLGHPKALLTVLPSAAIVGASLLILRRTGSVPAAASIILIWAFMTTALVGVTENGTLVSHSPWTGVFGLLAIYLMGLRLGLIYGLFMLLQGVLSLGAHHSGMTLPFSVVLPHAHPMAAQSNLMSIALICIMGYQFEKLRGRTFGELEDALLTVEHSESQLATLVENTTAMICSIDQSGRLIVFNSAFAHLAEVQRGTSPQAGDTLADVLSEAQLNMWQPHIQRVLASAQPARFEERDGEGEQAGHRETALYPLMQGGQVAGVTLFSHDISERKRAEAEMQRLHAQLVVMSREAGMAAVAGEVLHSAGNILTSVTVSASVLEARLMELRVKRLAQATALMNQHAGDLPRFLTEDPRGRQLLTLFGALAEHFSTQEQEMRAELVNLRDGIEDLTQVLRSQQGLARSVIVIEEVTAGELLDAALALHARQWEALEVDVQRDVEPLPPLLVDRYRVLEILFNLLSNARHALAASERPDRRLLLRVARAGEGRVAIEVHDNGVGIADENLGRIFQFGFTTRPDSKGIGLHSSANAAQQLGGHLSCRSEGPGKGAVFTLELPVRSPDSRERSGVEA